MKNRIFRSNNKKGYTLAEVLIAIAIIAILGAVAAISANRMIKDSRQKSLDKMAETIFLVAERNIQKAYWVDRASLGSGTVNDTSAENIKNKILPADTVSADISSAKWFIKYESKDDNCHVDYVYCTTSDNSYASTFAYDEGTLSSAWSSKEGKVGYYNGGDMDELPYTAGISSDKMYAALKVENKEELGVGVYIQLPDYEKNPDYYGSSSLNPKNVKYKLSITGLNSGAVYTFDEKELNPSSSKFTYQRRTKNCFISTDSESGGKCAIYRDYVVLDNLSDSTKQFKSVAKASESGLIPGEDILIEISATCVGSEAELSANANLAGGEAGDEAVFFENDSNGWGKFAQTNSLFAKREVVDADSDQVEVAYGRHLQNLDTLVSGMPEDKKLKVVQTKTIDFKITDTTVPINDNWIDLYGSDWTFTPIDNKKVDSYDGGAVINPSDGSVGADGQTQGVRNLIVNYTTRRARATDTAYETAKEKDRIISAGIFGKFYGSEIKNVLCHGFLIDYRRAEKLVEESTAVGCLVGRARTNLKLRNCRAENAELTAAQSFTTSQDKVMMGGLVGHALDGVDVQYCFADRNIIIGYENCCYASGLIGFTSSANYTPDSPQMDNTEAVMKDCKVSRSIVGGVRSGGIITGGMIAYTYNKNLIFENCIVEGVKFSASSGNGVAVVGGIVGSPIATTGLIKNCKVYNTADDEAAYVESAIGNNGVYDKSNIAKARKYVNSTAVAGTTNFDARNNSWMYTVGGSSTSEDGKIDIVSMGGLAGLNIVSSGNALVIENSFASTTMYAQNNRGINGGLIGNGRSKAKAIIRNSYADCYLNGQFISGLASNCKDSEYYNSYSTGFLRCDGAIKAAGITTSKATVSGCYSLMNYDNIWDTNKFNTTNLTFSDGYVTSYPGEAKPVNNNASLKNYIYLIAGDNSTVDENTYYTYGGDGDWIKDQSAQTSNKSQYASLRELVDKLGEQTDIIPSRLAPACISDNLASTKLPLILATSGTFTDTHYGDWLERPGNRLYARVYKTSDNKYVMFFEKGGRKSTLPTNSAITLTTVGEWLADDGSVVAAGATPSVDSGFLKQSDVLPTDADQSDATKLAKAKLIAPWQYDGTGNVSGWTASTVQSITSVTFDEDFCKDTKVSPAVSLAKPLSTRNWFKNFRALNSLNGIKNLDVSSVTSMKKMFFNCYRMPSYDISTWVTSTELNDISFMFGNANTDINSDGTDATIKSSDSRATATSIIFGSGFDTTSVENMKGMFMGQDGVTNLDLSMFKTESVTDFSYFGPFCTRLTSITGLSEFNVKKVTTLRCMFYGCTQIQSLDFSKWDTSDGKLTDLRGFIGGNAGKATTSIKFGELFNTQNVDTMAWAFEGLSNITELDLTMFNTSSVTDFEGMFSGCSKLKTIYASVNFVTDATDNSSGMFSSCSVLVGGCGTSFAGKSGTSNRTYAWIDGRDGNPNTGGSSEGYFTNKRYQLWARIYKINDNPDYELIFEAGEVQSGKELVEEYPGNTFLYERAGFPLGGGENKDWVAYAPWHGPWTSTDPSSNPVRENIIKASFTDGFCAAAKPVSMRNWFANMYRLSSIDFNTLDTSAVVNMMGTFQATPDSETNQLTTLDLTTFDTSSLQYTHYMFRDCKKLKTIRVSDDFDAYSLSSSNTTGMFKNCEELVGGCGTAWSDKSSGNNNVERKYAWIDGKDGNPNDGGSTLGYFTSEEFDGLHARIYERSNGDYYMYFEKGSVSQHEGGGSLVDGADWIGSGSKGFLNVSSADDDGYYNAAPWRNKYNAGVTEGKSIINKIKKVIFTDEFCNMAKPTNTRNWFSYMTSLTEIENIENLNTSNTVNMIGMFHHCSALTSLDLEGFDTSNVKYMRSMFWACSNLTTIYASESFITTHVTDNEKGKAYSQEMFRDCNKLIGGNGTAWVDMSGDAQLDTTYAWIDGRDNNPATGTSEGYFTADPDLFARVYRNSAGQYVMYFENGKVSMHKGEPGDVFVNGQEWQANGDTGFFAPSKPGTSSGTFENCPWQGSANSCVKVVFTDTFCRYAKPYGMRNFFYSFGNLEEVVNINKLDVSNVKGMAGLFQKCGKLKYVDISGWDLSSCTTTWLMFEDDVSLKTIYVDENVRVPSGVETTSMFIGCTSLIGGSGTKYSSLKINGEYARIDRKSDDSAKCGYFTLKTPGVYARVYDVSGQNVLRFEKYPQGDTIFSEGTIKQGALLTTNADGSFDGEVTWDGQMSNITSVEVNTPIKPAKTDNWFKDATALTSVDFKYNTGTATTTSMESMFEGCTTIAEIDIRNLNVSSVTSFNNMFKNCSSLVTIFARKNFVTDAASGATGTGMFTGCTKPLVGAKGTSYITGNDGIEYAHVDVDGSPGYFTQGEAYVPDGAHAGISHVTIMLPGGGTREAWYYNGVFYNTEAEAIAAWTKDNPSP